MLYTAGCALQTDEAPEPVGEAQSALVGGFLPMSFGSTTDEGGPVITLAHSCFLSGVSGNLSEGEQWYGGSRVSEAGLRGGRLRAHGGAYDPGTSSDLPNWINNYVGARAICVSDWDAAYVGSALLEVGATSPGSLTTSSVKIAGPDWSGHRQCWLTSLSGVSGTWVSANSYAKVKLYTTTDAQHPTAGWYIDARLMQSNYGHGEVTAACWDFPGADDWGTHVVNPSAGSPNPTTWTTLAGSACGLTEVTGDFTSNASQNGVYLTPPASAPYTSWSLTASVGKTGKAVCVH
jgi:hypothetical protein